MWFVVDFDFTDPRHKVTVAYALLHAGLPVLVKVLSNGLLIQKTHFLNMKRVKKFRVLTMEVALLSNKIA